MTERIPVTLKIKKELDRAVELEAYKFEVSKSDVVEMALKAWFELDRKTASETTPAPQGKEA